MLNGPKMTRNGNANQPETTFNFYLFTIASSNLLPYREKSLYLKRFVMRQGDVTSVFRSNFPRKAGDNRVPICREIPNIKWERAWRKVSRILFNETVITTRIIFEEISFRRKKFWADPSSVNRV